MEWLLIMIAILGLEILVHHFTPANKTNTGIGKSAIYRPFMLLVYRPLKTVVKLGTHDTKEQMLI